MSPSKIDSPNLLLYNLLQVKRRTAMVEFRHDWLSNIDSMQREMERLLNYFGSSKPPIVQFAPRAWKPSVDIYETEKEVVVVAELAGIKQEEINVIIDGNTLVIRGERKEASTPTRRTFYQMEICRGFFERGILLPAAVDPEQARASYKDGFLEIALPKVRREQTLRVKVKI
jgi:HSP20 family protein